MKIWIWKWRLVLVYKDELKECKSKWLPFTSNQVSFVIDHHIQTNHNKSSTPIYPKPKIQQKNRNKPLQNKNHTKLSHKINTHIIKTWKYLKVIDNVNRWKRLIDVKVLKFYHFGKTLAKKWINYIKNLKKQGWKDSQRSHPSEWTF